MAANFYHKWAGVPCIYKYPWMNCNQEQLNILAGISDATLNTFYTTINEKIAGRTYISGPSLGNLPMPPAMEAAKTRFQSAATHAHDGRRRQGFLGALLWLRMQEWARKHSLPCILLWRDHAVMVPCTHLGRDLSTTWALLVPKVSERYVQSLDDEDQPDDAMAATTANAESTSEAVSHVPSFKRRHSSQDRSRRDFYVHDPLPPWRSSG